MCHKSASKTLKPSKTEINSLPKELKFNIFCRLKVKLLCRLKCVCTEWNCLLSDPDFVKLHSDEAKRNRQLLLLTQNSDDRTDQKKVQPIHLFSVDMEEKLQFELFIPAKGYVDMMPSGHCLVCFANVRKFCTFNPVTVKLQLLPTGSRSIKKDLSAGFGYCPSKNEYILVHLFMQKSDEYEDEMECEILTLPNGEVGHLNSWRLLGERCPFIVDGLGVFVNNVFYWMISEDCEHVEEELILSFDLEKEKFEVFPHPHVQSYIEDNVMMLTELKGSLCLVDTFAYPSVTDIWMIKDYENRVWEKIYTIDLTNLVGFDDELTIITPFGFQNGEIIIGSGQEALDYYDVESKKFGKGENLFLNKNSQVCLYTDDFPHIKRN